MIMSKALFATSEVGTIPYMSPEILDGAASRQTLVHDHASLLAVLLVAIMVDR